jgi:hypothetical protein
MQEAASGVDAATTVKERAFVVVMVLQVVEALASEQQNNRTKRGLMPPF